jgi:adenylate cyclase
MNEYFSIIERVVRKHHGVIDKYIGDSVMAFFKEENHQQKSMKCIVEISRELKKFNEKNQLKFQTNFGVSSGEVMIGNIGSCERMQYTLIGDEVNLASRLEKLNKEFCSKILFTDNMAKDLERGFYIRPLQKIEIRGKKEEVVIWELLGSKSDRVNKAPDPSKSERERKAFDLYQQKKFEESKAIYEDLVKENQDDVTLNALYGKLLFG